MASIMQRLRGDTVDEHGVPKPLAPSAPRALTAAASRINLTSRSEIELLRRRKSTIQWQHEAWAYYDLIGEIWYAFNLVANVISRVRLYPALIFNPEEAPLPLSSLPEELKDEISPESALSASRILDRLKNSEGGISTILRDISLNICVAGELYLICKPGVPGLGIPEEWSIRSIDEISIDGSENMIVRPSSSLSSAGFIGPSSTTDSFILPKGSFVARIWRRHPRHSADADSSLRPLLHLCEEILLVSRVVRSTARSVLNSGILFVPDTLTVSASLTEADGDTLEEDQFENEFVDAMATPIADETSPSAAIPLLVRGPKEDGDGIKYIEIKRSFDPALVVQAEKALDRLLNGIEVPKETVTGISRAKYSNASSIDDSMYKAHVEPLMLMICDALNSVFFIPALKAYGVPPEDAEKLCIWYDPSEVVVRPNRTADADQGYDRRILSAMAWLRAHGFSEHDAASEEEKVLRLALDKGVLTPELTASMLAIIAPDVLAKTRAASQAANTNPLSDNVQSVLQGGPVTQGPSDSSPVPTTEVPPQTEATPGNNQPANNPSGGSNE